MTRTQRFHHYDLHNPDGTHRSTCSSTSGRQLAQHENSLIQHLDHHITIAEQITAETITIIEGEGCN